MTPTTEQQAVLDMSLEAGEACKLIAYAGTGKTATLIELAKKHPVERILYLAFNKSVEQDACMRFPCNTTTKTGHSVAYAAIGKRYRKITNLQNWQIAKAYQVPIYDATIMQRTLENFLNSAESDITEVHVEPDRLGRHDPTLFTEGFIQKTKLLWQDMQYEANGFNMAHSGYMKLFQLTKPDLGYPIVLLDEAQDTNPVMLRILLDQQEVGSRVYLVGDPYQQIYAWRGALDAMTKIECPGLWLTQSFRFGEAVAGLATTLLSTFFNETHSVKGLPSIGSKIVEGKLTSPYTVLCRTNAGLVSQAYEAARGDACIAVNGESGFRDTLNFMQEIFFMLSGQRNRVTERRLFFHPNYKALRAYAEETLDVELLSKLQVVETYGAEWPKVKDTVLSHLVLLGSADVILSTCHKAKGLEWDRVALNSDFEDLLDEKGEVRKVVRTPLTNEIASEEVNLIYVAATRAKLELSLPHSIHAFLKKTLWTSKSLQ